MTIQCKFLPFSNRLHRFECRYRAQFFSTPTLLFKLSTPIAWVMNSSWWLQAPTTSSLPPFWWAVYQFPFETWASNLGFSIIDVMSSATRAMWPPLHWIQGFNCISRFCWNAPIFPIEAAFEILLIMEILSGGGIWDKKTFTLQTFIGSSNYLD